MSRLVRPVLAVSYVLLLLAASAQGGRRFHADRPWTPRAAPVERAVPEPGAALVFALGAGIVGFGARRLRR